MKLAGAIAALAVLAVVTAVSVVQVAAGDADGLAWVLLVAGPLGMAAAAAEVRGAVRERRDA
jgi:hypothetical protein